MTKTLEQLDEEALTSRDCTVQYRYKGGRLRIDWYPNGNKYFIDGQSVTRAQADEFVRCGND